MKTPGSKEMKTHEVLQKARDLLADRKHWAQNWFAYDKYGSRVGPTDKRATCWCSAGAICKVEGRDDNQSRALDLLDEALLVHFNWGKGVPDYNDIHTHEQVLAVFSKAIELAKVEEG